MEEPGTAQCSDRITLRFWARPSACCFQARAEGNWHRIFCLGMSNFISFGEECGGRGEDRESLGGDREGHFSTFCILSKLLEGRCLSGQSLWASLFRSKLHQRGWLSSCALLYSNAVFNPRSGLPPRLFLVRFPSKESLLPIMSFPAPMLVPAGSLASLHLRTLTPLTPSASASQSLIINLMNAIFTLEQARSPPFKCSNYGNKTSTCV